MQNRTRVLITGASGTVGTALLHQILDYENEYEITIFDLNTKKNRKLFNPYKERINIIYGDISDSREVDTACMQQDVVIHLAAVIPPMADKNTSLAHRVNVLGTRNLIEALETYSPGAWFLYASSISIYGDRVKNPEIRIGDPLQVSENDYYAQTKIEAEAIVRNSRLDWSIFRLTFITGFKNHKISPLMFHVPLETCIEIATPEDAARAFLHAIGKRAPLLCKTFNLGGGKDCRCTYREFLRRSFSLYGLGKLNFPTHAFAKRNFHCGYYMDGNELENILNFRRETLDHYFHRVKMQIPGVRRFFTRLLSPSIKRSLLKKSDPLKAMRRKNSGLIRRFFGGPLPSA